MHSPAHDHNAIVALVILVAFSRVWEGIKSARNPFTLVLLLKYTDTFDRSIGIPHSRNIRAMSNYSSFGQYMDPNVFRSTSHPVHYHVDTDLVSPRYIAANASRSLRHGDRFMEPLSGRHFADSQLGQTYLSDRHNIDQHSSRDVDNLVRKYDTARFRCRNLELTSLEPTTTSPSQTAPSTA